MNLLLFVVASLVAAEPLVENILSQIGPIQDSECSVAVSNDGHAPYFSEKHVSDSVQKALRCQNLAAMNRSMAPSTLELNMNPNGSIADCSDPIGDYKIVINANDSGWQFDGVQERSHDTYKSCANRNARFTPQFKLSVVYESGGQCFEQFVEWKSSVAGYGPYLSATGTWDDTPYFVYDKKFRYIWTANNGNPIDHVKFDGGQAYGYVSQNEGEGVEIGLNVDTYDPSYGHVFYSLKPTYIFKLCQPDLLSQKYYLASTLWNNMRATAYCWDGEIMLLAHYVYGSRTKPDTCNSNRPPNP